MARIEGFALTFLVNAAWQLPLVVVVARAGAALLRSAPAAYRHRLWMAALVLGLVLPLGRAVHPGPDKKDAPRHTGSPPAALPGAAGPVASAPAPGSRLESAYPLGRSAGLVAAGYLCFLLLRTVRLARAWRDTVRLVRRSQGSPASLQAVLADCAKAVGRVPVLRVSKEVPAPMTFGLRRPVIVLPPSLAEAAAPEVLRGALAHELAHVARHDCAINLACELMALPLSFHPVAGSLKRRLRGARETACDEAAAALVGALAYARTLLEVARSSCPSPRLAGAVGVLDGDALEERMKRILDVRPTMDRRRATLALGAAVLALVVAGRTAATAAVAITTEAGPSDMVGRWTATLPEGPFEGKPAAEMTIALGPDGPEIALTLYRYRIDPGGEPAPKPALEHPPVVDHSVSDGVLRFRTRVEDFRLGPDEPPAPMEADWEFSVVGRDEGQLRVVRNSRLEAEKKKGVDVPPPPPPLPMKRVPRP